MEVKTYDIIIIGGGSAGLGAIGMAESLGWKPLLIDKKEEHIGGDCLNFGCVPSKAIIHLSKYFHGAKQAEKYGAAKAGKADMQKVLAYVHEKQEVIRAHESADYFRSKGIDIAIGTASFVNKNTVSVEDQHYTAKHILLATGSKPRHLAIKGMEQVQWFTNETLFYNLTELPERLLVIGGGAIGCEMGQAFQRFGSQVTIVNRGKRIIGVEREDSSAILAKVFEQEGVEILNNTTVVEFKDSHTAIIEHKEKGQSELQFDAVLIAAGRVLNYTDLNLAAADIETTERGSLVVNEYLQTTNDQVFVAGDAAGMYKFSHGAEKHIRLLTDNFTGTFKRKHDASDLSWVTFTDPEVASFGYTERELKEKEISYWRQDQSFHKDDRAIVGSYEYGRITLFVTPKSLWKQKRTILGGCIIAPNAGELMQELQLAAKAELSIEEIYNKLYAYPTASRINQQTIKGIVDYKEESA